MDHFEQELHSDNQEQLTEGAAPAYKSCAQCHEDKPLTEFLRRSGRRGGKSARRGTCRACRKLRKQESLLTEETLDYAESEAPDVYPVDMPEVSIPTGESTEDRPKKRRRRRRRKKPVVLPVLSNEEADDEAPPPPPKIRIKRPLPLPPPRPKGPDASVLRPNRDGILWMRGRTDKGRRWQQETDLETAVNLVTEHAAIVVNKHTVRRIYSNKTFRLFILTRDRYTCHFCGEYGDTIDHIVPRAKGGHTTPVNCVCACNECNQMKADQNWEDFIDSDPILLEEPLALYEQDQLPRGESDEV
ncbi:HNH endonuclease [Paenibacillus puerhi]|uniref:HNH endonuclease n=1 Tax=Paenibacillus puerhi TaxID=2692622 RepID=UPI001F454E82|nr:HNH endonuclease [Paenibacillus puerhi]